MNADTPVEARIRRALREVEHEAPLPAAFASDVARRLPDRPATRPRWSMRARTLVGSAVVVLVLAVLAGAALLPQLRATPAASTASSPAVSTTPVPPTASPTSRPSVVALAHYSSGAVSFDYPANWQVFATRVDQHYKLWGPALGIGEWHYICATIAPTNGSGGGSSCQGPTWAASPGGVVVVFEGNAAPGRGQPTPPPGAVPLAGGIVGVETENPMGSEWQIFYPAATLTTGDTLPASTVTIVATYAPPNVEVSREQVRALVRSIRYDPSVYEPTLGPSN